jgi:hypothetical protein
MDYSYTDEELAFLDAAETGELEAFGHREHLRLAFLAARASATVDEVTARCRSVIQTVAAAKGAPGTYHETVTAAWAAIMLSAAAALPEASFDELLVRHGELLERRYLERFYSPARLRSDGARRARVAPDRAPLPVVPQAALRPLCRRSSQARSSAGGNGGLSR